MATYITEIKTYKRGGTGWEVVESEKPVEIEKYIKYTLDDLPEKRISNMCSCKNKNELIIYVDKLLNIESSNLAVHVIQTYTLWNLKDCMYFIDNNLDNIGEYVTNLKEKERINSREELIKNISKPYKINGYSIYSGNNFIWFSINDGVRRDDLCKALNTAYTEGYLQKCKEIGEI